MRSNKKQNGLIHKITNGNSKIPVTLQMTAIALTFHIIAVLQNLYKKKDNTFINLFDISMKVF
jgi:hypothetical protein